jgi:hypothetical protein
VLRELQLAFLDAVRAGDGGAGGLALRIAGDDRMDARGRLGIYADMYRLRLAAALAATVPQTAAALGAPAGVPERSPRSPLVWREGSTVYHRAVDAVERAALGAAAAGLSFGALCERLADLLPPAEAAQRAGALLLRWLRDQLLVDDPA